MLPWVEVYAERAGRYILSVRVSSDREVQGEEKARPRVHSGFVFELAPERRHKALRDREPKAGRGECSTACSRWSAERLKQCFLRRGMNPRACVLDREFYVS